MTVTLEQVEELYDMLKGEKLPEEYYMLKLPKLSADVAFSVIWFIQERLQIIPDKYEKCEACDEIYDSEEAYHGNTIVAEEYNDEQSFVAVLRNLCEPCQQKTQDGRCEECCLPYTDDVPLDDDGKCPFCLTGRGKGEKVLSSELLKPDT